MSALQRPTSLPPRSGKLFASTAEKCWAAVEAGQPTAADHFATYLQEEAIDPQLAQELAAGLMAQGLFRDDTATGLEKLLPQASPQLQLAIMGLLRGHHQQQGRHTQAYQTLKRMALHGNATPNLLVESGKEALQRGLLEDALTISAQLARQPGRAKEAQQLAMAVAVKNPRMEAAYTQVNQLCLHGGDEAMAAKFYEKLQEKFPNEPLPQRFALALATNAGQQEDALKKALAIQEQNPEDEWTLRQVLKLAVSGSDGPLAADTALKLYGLTQDTKLLDIVARFAPSLPPEKAVGAYSRLLEIEPDKGPWMIALSRQYLRMGDLQTSLEVIHQYASLPFAEAARAGTVLSVIHEKLKEMAKSGGDEATYVSLLGTLGGCLEELKGEAELSMIVADALLEHGQAELAERLYMTAVEHPAFRVRALVGESRSLLVQGKNQQAEGVAWRALDELKNEDKRLLWVIAQATKDTEPLHAVDALERLLKAHPDDTKGTPTSAEAQALLDQLRESGKGRRSTAPGFPPRGAGTDPMKKVAQSAGQHQPTQSFDQDDIAFFASMREKYSGGGEAAPAAAPQHLQGKPKSEGEQAKENLFARYKTEKTIGKGGMGTVYLASDTLLERTVAIKIINAGGLTARDKIDRMGREAKAIAKLSHPNVINVFDVGLFEDFKYLVMEYVDGLSLKQLLGRRGGKGLPLASTKHIATQVAGALAHAHDKGIVHRDIKPDNVLVSRSGEVKVMDFGLAKFLDNSEQTVDGITAGTLQYMAPEQFSGKNLDHRADIYAFGCLLYEMVVGKPPFEGNDLTKMMYKHLSDPPPPLPDDIGPARDALQAIIFKCLAKKPDERPANLEDVREELVRVT